ncbi:MAG: IS66 family insertion sequence hypothetical protein, partial [Marinomonas sp.]
VHSSQENFFARFTTLIVEFTVGKGKLM